jgi:hypothetical protein
VLWPFLQIFDQDLLKWIQWFENVSKLIRTTLESTKVKSNEEKPNSEKIPYFTHIHLAKFANLQPRPPMLDLLLVEYLYMINKHNCIKETRIKSKEISKPSHI